MSGGRGGVGGGWPEAGQCKEAAVEGRQTARGRADTKAVVGGLTDGGLQGRRGAREAGGRGGGGLPGRVPHPSLGQPPEVGLSDHGNDSRGLCSRVSGAAGAPLPAEPLGAPTRAPCPATTASC